MSRGRKPREAPDPQVILAILRSTISRWQEGGGKFSILNLDPTRNALGIVLDGAYLCLNCSEWHMRGPKHEKNICEECQKKLDASG